jgi:transcriptional regulator with XRE-family HTH domain
MDICISDNLKLLRYKNGYTLEAIAEIISVSRQSVSKWESGDSVPDITNCVKLASLYKISLDELVNRPLRRVIDNDFPSQGDRICGVLEISDDNTIRIPDSVMEMFDMKCGDKALLLADRKQGIAIVKCSRF